MGGALAPGLYPTDQFLGLVMVLPSGPAAEGFAACSVTRGDPRQDGERSRNARILILRFPSDEVGNVSELLGLSESVFRALLLFPWVEVKR